MTLLVDLCETEHPLSRDEFVYPIARIVKRAGEEPIICHYKELDGDALPEARNMILCGTALRNLVYLEHMDRFSWITEGRIPVLGICAGMQVISSIFGGTQEEREEIGITGIQVVSDDPLLQGYKEFEAYELHSLSIVPPRHFQVLAVSARCPQVIRHPHFCIYGVMFHPEVRHGWVVERFLHQASIHDEGME